MLEENQFSIFISKKNILGRRNRAYQPSNANRQNPDMYSPLAQVFTKILLT